jgi:uncharacterized protein
MTAPSWSSQKAIAPSASKVGYGLEGALNDLTSKTASSARPSCLDFKVQDFYGGITAGVGQMITVIDGEPLPDPSNAPSKSIGSVQQYAPVLFILALAVGGLLRSVLGKIPVPWSRAV